MTRYPWEHKVKPHADNAAIVGVEEKEAPLVGPSSDEAAIQEFVSSGALGAAFRANQWSPAAEVDMLTSIATNDKLPSKERMAAANILHSRAMERLRFSGHLATISARQTHTNEDGSIVEEMEIVSRIQGRTADLLKAAKSSGKVIDVSEEETEETTPTPPERTQEDEKRSSGSDRLGCPGTAGGEAGGEPASGPDGSPTSPSYRGPPQRGTEPSPGAPAGVCATHNGLGGPDSHCGGHSDPRRTSPSSD
jgi:hypothetical protein